MTMFELFKGGKASAAPKSTDQQSLQIAFEVDDLETSMEELKNKGVNFISDIGQSGPHRWIYFTDPEGNQLEIMNIASSC